MNKKFLLMTAALALSLPWAGCSKSSKLDQASTFTPPGGPVELKLKWTKDERIVQEMDMKQTSELTIPGQTAPMKQEMALQQEDRSHRVEGKPRRGTRSGNGIPQRQGERADGKRDAGQL